MKPRVTFDPLKHPIMFETPRRLDARSGWLEHFPFAMLLVELLRPDVFVELGTGAGDSYCTFCQAVDTLGLRTRCYAVDAWTGGSPAGTGGAELLTELRAHHDRLYGGFSRLIQASVDDAVAHFSDASIDLLHLRGSRAYGSGRHDVDAWLPKMSQRGVILVHGINIRETNVGVWRVWEDVKTRHPSLEFPQAQGLGVLGVGSALPDSIRDLFDLSEDASAAIRRYFERLGHRLRLLADVTVVERRLAEERAERERAVEGLKRDLRRAHEEAAQRGQVVDWLKADLQRAREQVVETEQFRQVEREADRLRHELNALRDSWSWKLTTPVRHLASVLRGGAGVRPRARRAWNGLRELWHRTAYDAVSLRALTPVAVEAESQDPRDVIRWSAPLQITDLSPPTLSLPPPARVTYRFVMPPRARFRSLIALPPEVWDRHPGGVDFTVAVSVQDGSRSLEKTWHVDPTKISRHRRWRACRLRLARFTDREVALTLRTSVPVGVSADLAGAVWGDPAICSRKPAREIWRAWVSSGTRAGVGDPPSSVVPEEPLVPETAPSPTAAPASSPRGFLERTWRDKLKLFLSDPASTLVFPACPDPLVSIVIPTFDRAEYLYQCLESLLAHTTVPFEVIVVDDGSRDDTPELLRRLRNVTCARNEENLEFIRTCNRGIHLAKGRYLLFLNNDVTVTPQWLSTLVETMERFPRCGAVGAKLVRPDGTLQEAGSIIWRDGSASGYGRDDDPLKPEYCYLREVDYCSAACLLVRTDLVRELGGFDERYLPAYYEDADLCFGVRRLGYTVVFQPHVSVFHYEFGSRSPRRAEALCAANYPNFAVKWVRELQNHRPHGEMLSGRDRRAGQRVLMMDDRVPSPDLGSGLPRTYTMLQLLAESGFVVTFVPLLVRTPPQPATRCLQQLGVEVFYGDTFRLEDLLRERAGGYDIVLISRPHNAETVLPLARQHLPHARIIYDAEALFCARDFRKAELDGLTLSDTVKRVMVRRELDLMKQADVVITVSESERALILLEEPYLNVSVWGHAHDVHEPITPFSQRRDLLFVGGFLNGHPPNVDGVLYFATTLFPKIRLKLPDCRFVVVGIHPPACVQELASQHIVVAGYVEDLTEYYERCRVFVAPLRFGGGISLKLIEAMSYGIPAVVSAFGGMGLDLQDRREAMIAKRDDEFVDEVVRLYEDEALWTTVQRAAHDYIRRHCSPETMRQRLADTLATVGTAPHRTDP